jgi:AraC-like DNA-binding protein
MFMKADSHAGHVKTSAVVLPGIINTAVKLGVDIQDILQRLGISIDLEHITRSTIGLNQVHAIVMEMEKATGHPAIGLLNGENFDFEYMPHLKTFLMSSSTIREAFENTRSLRELISPLLILKLVETGDEVIIKLQPDRALSEEDERHYTEMVFSCIKNLVNRLMKKIVPPKIVYFRHGRSEIIPLYEDFFGSSIVLNARENGISYESIIMDIPLPGGLPEIRWQAQNILNQQIADSPLHNGLAEEIRMLLVKRDDLLNASLKQLAECLNMSARTLQRRLAENGYGWSELRDQIRFQLAVQALRSKRLNIEEISDKLGFSDRHSFTRAFKRWSGHPPSAYRRKYSP